MVAWNSLVGGFEDKEITKGEGHDGWYGSTKINKLANKPSLMYIKPTPKLIHDCFTFKLALDCYLNLICSAGIC